MNDPRSRDFLNQLGIESWEDGLVDGKPPVPVDIEKLAEYYQGNLNEDESELIAMLLSCYQDWHDAGRMVLKQLAIQEIAYESANTPILIWKFLHQRQVLFGIAASLLLVVGGFLWLAPQNNEFNDGKNLVAIRNGIVTGLGEYGPEWTSLAHTALIDNQLPNPENVQELTDGLRSKRGMTLSKAIVAPYLTAVREQSPLLQWRVIGNPLGYRVIVKDAQTMEIVSSDKMESDLTEALVSAKLDRGRMYVWDIMYRYADSEMKAPKAGDAPTRFLVLSADSLRRLEADEAIIGDSMFLRVLLYVREGLFDEAEVMLEKLASSNNGSIYLDTLSKLLRKKRATLFEKQDDKDIFTGQP